MKKQLRIIKKGDRYDIEEKSLNTFFLWQRVDRYSWFYTEKEAKQYFEIQITKHKLKKEKPKIIEEITLE